MQNKRSLTYEKMFVNFLLVLGLVFTFSTTTFAYIKPSMMTYKIDIVAGVVVTVDAAIGIYWRKAKKKVQDKLGIDENTNKRLLRRML